MGIRTPDLLHAMERRTVHHSPRQATRDCPELRIRSQQSTSVHDSPLRTVTSLVTSPVRDHAGHKHQGSKKPASPDLSPHFTSLARDPARRYCPAAFLPEPVVSGTGAPAHPGSASSCPAPRGRQCTPGSRDRTAGARPAARPEPLPRHGFPGRTAAASTSDPGTGGRSPLAQRTARGPAGAGRIPRPAAARSCGQRPGRPA
jgi:hypothetical protein